MMKSTGALESSTISRKSKRYNNVVTDQRKVMAHNDQRKINKSNHLIHMLYILTILSLCIPLILLSMIEHNPLKDQIKASLFNKEKVEKETLFKHENLDVETKNDVSVIKRYEALPLSKTPALLGSKKGHIECDTKVDFLVYWNDPQGTRDQEFLSPFATKGKTKYLSFEPDSGGWNNIRISMENLFVIAAATGRVLVLPPDSPKYLLTHDTNKRMRGFADFFNLENKGLLRYVSVITMEEFFRREGGENGRLPIPSEIHEEIISASKECVKLKKEINFCQRLYDHLLNIGNSNPQVQHGSTCFIFDIDVFEGRTISEDNEKRVKEFCGDRTIIYYTTEFEAPILWHFRTSKAKFRILLHFYSFIFFTDPKIDNIFKRFVRDFLHYNDAIFCAAGKVIQSLKKNDAIYSSLHIRRGDFQYKRQKLSAEEWYSNTKEIWLPEEILYIATDEKEKDFFNPISKYHKIYTLNDFWETAKLDQIDPNYLGMIDTIVSSYGRAFAGTFRSTFSGYINRLRGYYNISMRSS